MGVKCSRRRLHTETRIYMLKWSNPCECTVRVIEVVEQRRLGLERAGEGWGEVGCEYGLMGGRGEILGDRTILTPFPHRGYVCAAVGAVHARGGRRVRPRGRKDPPKGSPGPPERALDVPQRT